MALGQVLDQIRDYYVSRFVDAVNEHADDGDAEIAHETAYRNAEGDVVVQGRLQLPMRGDVFLIRDGEVTDSLQIDTEGMLSFEPVAIAWDDGRLHVDLQPFQWNWMQMRMHGLPPDPDWTALRAWFLEWFGDDDPPADGLLNGVHFMSDPDEDGGVSQLSIDLGTAPVEAFEGLLDAAASLGADRVQIGQFQEAG